MAVKTARNRPGRARWRSGRSTQQTGGVTVTEPREPVQGPLPDGSPAPGMDAPGTSVCVGGFDDNPTDYLNRELSWLAFNARVLQLARDRERPLLERVRFAAIFADNLDEFVQIRVSGLHDLEASGLGGRAVDGRTAGEQLATIRDVMSRLGVELDDLVAGTLIPELAEAGVHLIGWDELDAPTRDAATEEFRRAVLPVLTPLAVDPGHPFPYISDRSLNLAVTLHDPADGRRLFARVKVPPNLDRFVDVGNGRWVLVEEIIAAHLDELFVGLEVTGHHVFRVTRNADLSVDEDEAEDLLAAVESEVRRRRFGRAVRLEVAAGVDPQVQALLLRELDLDEHGVIECRGVLAAAGLHQIAGLDRPELQTEPWPGITEPALCTEDGDVDVFAAMRRGDVLLHHPYSSFGRSMVELLHGAAVDPDVLAIKITLYRVSGDSPIVASLAQAADAGKQVAVLIELKARFDEETNIEWARVLERHGVHVTYGLVGLKTHTKCCMIIRQEPSGLRRYCHVGTGNYNDRTARIYEDLSLLTCDPDVGEDMAQLFNRLTGYGRDNEYRRLLVAPDHLRRGLCDLIEGEMRADRGHIVMKMNSLVDAEMIDLLYDASRAGVDIDLIVRGICCLRPGVPGLSDRIRVRSVVGRYLEHSRIFRFANGAGPGRPRCLIGSADLMDRNLNRRVEAMVGIDDPGLVARLDEVLDTALADDRLAWDLDGDGVWTRTVGARGLATHDHLMDLARVRCETE